MDEKTGPFTTGDAAKGFEVGFRYDDGRLGPVASVEIRDGWLLIETDPYEGSAMLKLECLPHLRRALEKLEKTQAKVRVCDQTGMSEKLRKD